MVYRMGCSFNLVFVTKMASSSPHTHPIFSCIECIGIREEHTWVGLLVRIYWTRSTGCGYTWIVSLGSGMFGLDMVVSKTDSGIFVWCTWSFTYNRSGDLGVYAYRRRSNIYSLLPTTLTVKNANQISTKLKQWLCSYNSCIVLKNFGFM